MADDTQTRESQKTLSLLATEQFGNKYTGEPPEPGEQTQETEAEAEENNAKVEGDEVVETEETAEAAEEQTGESEGEETEETESYELPQIAQLLGVEQDSLDVDDEGKIILHGKVDGEPVRTTFKNLIDNYQMYEAADKRLENAKVKVKAQNQELAQKSEAVNAQFAQAAKLIESAEKFLDKDTAEVDWKALRQDDPAEYSAKLAEVNQRREEIKKMKEEALAAYEQSVEQNKVDGAKLYKEHLQAEHQALLKGLPEWSDNEKAQAEKIKLTKYLIKQGFAEDDVKQAADHRLIIMARKAMLYDEAQGKNSLSKKKVAKIPKVIKPGTPKAQEQVNREKIEKQRAKLKQSGSLDDAFALLKVSSAT